jgi:hypothetical protein
MRPFDRVAVAVVFVVALITFPGCGAADIDVATSIKIGNITSGWFDAGIVDGKNKLVPSASFTVTNTSQVPLSALQIYSVFRFVGETEELGTALVILHGADALGPGATSKPVTVRAHWGATGEQPRAQMLMHRLFQDARVEIFAKYGTGKFVKLTETTVKRQLLTN